uniref:Uncharacterized protein n=1 Tax=Anopheles merus TaxID=30066 RepID=A0A182UPW7_ANOME
MSAESIHSSAAHGHGRQGRRSVPVARGGPLLVGYLLATVFVVGTLCAWQENVRPKLYVTLGKLSRRNAKFALLSLTLVLGAPSSFANPSCARLNIRPRVSLNFIALLYLSGLLGRRLLASRRCSGHDKCKSNFKHVKRERERASWRW